jgi:phosphoserine phosphatase RsbU/P
MAASPNLTAPLPSDPRPLNLDQVEDLLTLQKAAQKISSILDLDQLVDKVVNEIAHSFGCLDSDIYPHNEERGELSLVCAHGCIGCELHGPRHSLKIGKGMVGYVASSGQMHYAPDVRQDPYYIGCEESTLSEVAIPLHVEGELVGVFTTSHPELNAFGPCQLRLLQALCSDVAVAVHNARRFQQEQRQREQMTREAREARVIQQALLPKTSPCIPGFTVSGLSIPVGAVGGDWYDFIPMDKGRWGLVLADVSGKGTAAALLMSATRGMLRSLAEAACTPGEVLTKLNRLLVEDFPAGRFVTMVYVVLDPAKRTLTFANAGHLPPLPRDRRFSRVPRRGARNSPGTGTERFLGGGSEACRRFSCGVLQRRYYRGREPNGRRVRVCTSSRTFFATRLLLIPDEPEVQGLLALMLNCESRRAARRGPDRDYIPLSEQDTKQWSKPLIAEAEQHLAVAFQCGRPGRFQLEAAIQSVHAERSQTGRTDWTAIAAFYQQLVRISPTLGPLTGAAALAEATGPQSGLTVLDGLESESVSSYQSYWAVRAHLLQWLGKTSEALDAYERAIGLAEDPAVRGFLLKRRG